MGDTKDAYRPPVRPRECGLFGIGIGPRKPHDQHEWTDGDGGWFACTGHAEPPTKGDLHPVEEGS